LAVAPPSDASDIDGGLCANVPEVVAKQDVLEIVDVECLSFCESPPASPRSNYVSRKPCSQHFEEPILAEWQERSCREGGEKTEVAEKREMFFAKLKQCDKIAPSPKVDEVMGKIEVAMPCSEIAAQTSGAENAVSPLVEAAESIASPRQVTPFRPKNQPEATSRPSRKKDANSAESKSVTNKQPNGGYPALAPSLGRAGTPNGGTSALPPTPGRASTPSRPVTPSWLEPPWPRSAQEAPFNSWTRPGTPSTVCDEADLVRVTTPKSKLVDGHCIAIRPTSSCKRLPPLNSPPVGKSAW